MRVVTAGLMVAFLQAKLLDDSADLDDLMANPGHSPSSRFAKSCSPFCVPLLGVGVLPNNRISGILHMLYPLPLALCAGSIPPSSLSPLFPSSLPPLTLRFSSSLLPVLLLLSPPSPVRPSKASAPVGASLLIAALRTPPALPTRPQCSLPPLTSL
ncbi:unnamed protein product [Closterium sp. Naga37s-1]|nr:unnamed protein product [Closterium sp. Naga37s-1]